MFGGSKSVAKSNIPNIGGGSMKGSSNSGGSIDMAKKFIKDTVPAPKAISTLLKEPKTDDGEEVDPYSFDGD